jgi:hypothetical protein
VFVYLSDRFGAEKGAVYMLRHIKGLFGLLIISGIVSCLREIQLWGRPAQRLSGDGHGKI